MKGRTFGLESAIKQVGGIYAPRDQKYELHDKDMLLSYREDAGWTDSRGGRKGLPRRGSMASFTAAGTAVCELQGATIHFL